MYATDRFWERWRHGDEWVLKWEAQLARPGIRPVGFAWAYACVLVYERDHGSCRICEQTDCLPLDVHHIIPLKDGGNSLLENLLLVGKPCHKNLHAHEIQLHGWDPHQTRLEWFEQVE